jgi:hypothetical protein
MSLAITGIRIEVSTAVRSYGFGGAVIPLAQHAHRTFQRNLGTTRVVAPLQGDEFFNREREISALKGIFNGAPKLSVISGPVNSGKTALIRKVLEDISTGDRRPILHIDLRSASFDTVGGFQRSLELGMTDWLEACRKVAARMSLNLEAGDVKVDVSLKQDKDVTPIEKLDLLYNRLDRALPSWKIWTGRSVPILFVDEANEMAQLLKDKGGHEALLSLFKWIVMNTKQDRRFHVVLGTSDSFFHLWIAKYIGTSRFTSYVVGDLSKEEAKRFWNERVITSQVSSKEFSAPLFDDAYQVCGGNMFSLQNYFQQLILSQGTLRPEGFSLARAEGSKIIKAFYSEENRELWQQDQLTQMMSKLTSAEGGFLVYKDLCAELGQSVIDAFIAQNLLHLRPTRDYAYDIPNAPYDKEIVTAETPAALYAMRRFLKDLPTEKSVK